MFNKLGILRLIISSIRFRRNEKRKNMKNKRLPYYVNHELTGYRYENLNIREIGTYFSIRNLLLPLRHFNSRFQSNLLQ